MRTIAWTALAVVSCGCAPTPTTPGSGAHLSAAQEDVAAARHEREAADHRASFDPGARTRQELCTHHGVGADGDFYECWESVVNPTQAQLGQARLHELAADEHRARSQALRSAEARACSGLPAADLAESPFAHRGDIVGVSPLPRGALVVFKHVPTLTAEHLQKIIDCHIARNDALGHDVPEMSYCPLVPRDVTANVTPVQDGFAVTIESTDDQSVREVRARAEALKP
jgi:hypothetical protein